MDKSRIAIPAIRSIPAESSADDRELDDPFSAWDEDDAGVHRQSSAPQLPGAAQTRMERKPSRADAAADAPPASAATAPPVLDEGSSRRITTRTEPLVDPVAMRDIVMSRARTLDDPLTTRMLAEIARKRTRSNIAIAPPQADHEAAPDEPALGERPTMKLTPLRLPTTAAAAARSENRATRSHDTLSEEVLQPTPPDSSDTRATREEIPSPNRRGARRPVARDEPFRK